MKDTFSKHACVLDEVHNPFVLQTYERLEDLLLTPSRGQATPTSHLMEPKPDVNAKCDMSMKAALTQYSLRSPPGPLPQVGNKGLERPPYDNNESCQQRWMHVQDH